MPKTGSKPSSAILYKSSDLERVIPLADEISSHPHRSRFRRDFGRLLHSPAFRRAVGKTQLFPSQESDYFRNRLTHSLEVAQVAKAIASQINATDSHFKSTKLKIDLDLVETVALAHDLGHPPFGHNGEEALDECMIKSGGFEGNAQTLRILSCLEKRDLLDAEANDWRPIVGGVDKRVGLNLTYRTLAGVLKYDSPIPETRPELGLRKGYYSTEKVLVDRIKEKVGYDDKALANEQLRVKATFRTLECSIMDIADDIAYSIYDLDDTFKAGFLDPLTMLTEVDTIAANVFETVVTRINKFYPDLPPGERAFKPEDIQSNLLRSFVGIFQSIEPGELIPTSHGNLAKITGKAVIASKEIARDGYFRHSVTSWLIKQFLQGIEVLFEPNQPWLSRARLKIETFKQVEVLKNYTYEATIMSSRMKVLAYRGKKVVKEIFHSLRRKDGWRLMPEDVRSVYEQVADGQKKRVICDFIAGMTDRYAVEFHNRLHSTNRESFYSPQ